MKHRLPAFRIVIPTANRAESLARTLRSIAAQDVAPARIVVADRSADATTRRAVESARGEAGCPVEYRFCRKAGAAVQRNQGAEGLAEPVVLFIDDDILLEPGCLRAMLAPLADDAAGAVGGVGAVNLTCHYGAPSRLTRWVLDRLADQPASSHAGRLIGPALNLPPAMEGDGPVSRVDWLASGCVAYRREAFEATGFGTFFHRYSLAEDVHLSARVARRWRLLVAHGARYDHRPPAAKAAGVCKIGELDVVGRHQIMTEVLGRRGPRYAAKFALLQAYQFAGAVKGLRASTVNRTAALWLGRLAGYGRILLGAGPVARRASRVEGVDKPCAPVDASSARPLVSLAIVSRDRREQLLHMLGKCREQTYGPIEILVLDDASVDGSAEAVRRRFPDVRVVRRERSEGLIAARNHLFGLARGEWIVSLDDDAWLVDPWAVERLVGAIGRDPRVGVVTFRVFDHAHPVQAVDEQAPLRLVHTFSGGASAIRRRTFEQVGPYRGFYQYGAEETDLAMRLLDAGWRIVSAPWARVFHDKKAGDRNVPFTFRHGACNNLCNSVLNEPAVQAAMHIPVLLAKQLRFALRRRCLAALGGALALWVRRLPMLLEHRRPLAADTFRLQRRLAQGTQPLNW